MRTDLTDELCANALTYVRALCNDTHHPQVVVLTELKRMIDIELNRMSGLEPDRNK